MRLLGEARVWVGRLSCRSYHISPLCFRSSLVMAQSDRGRHGAGDAWMRESSEPVSPHGSHMALAPGHP